MGCPVHIWAPMMVGTLPIARVLRDRLRASLSARSSASSTRETAPEAEPRRWAPIQPSGSRPSESQAAHTSGH